MSRHPSHCAKATCLKMAIPSELLPGRDSVRHDVFPDALELVKGGVVQVRVGVQADRFALIFKISSSQPIEKDDSANSF